MPNRLRKLVAWTLLAQVTLVGGLGTGLHALFGCEHGSGVACAAPCCTSAEEVSKRVACEHCAFCRHATEERGASPSSDPAAKRSRASVVAAGCDGCAVCDLLAQYHSVTPFEFDSLSVELASSEAALHRHNAVVAAATRLAPSRGPPAV